MQVEIVTNARSLRHREFSERGDARLQCRAALFLLPFVSFHTIRDDPRHSTSRHRTGISRLCTSRGKAKTNIPFVSFNSYVQFLFPSFSTHIDKVALFYLCVANLNVALFVLIYLTTLVYFSLTDVCHRYTS